MTRAERIEELEIARQSKINMIVRLTDKIYESKNREANDIRRQGIAECSKRLNEICKELEKLY